MSFTQPPSRPAPDGALIGLLSALGCFSFWGLFPIYFKLLAHVPALEVLAHRIVGSAVVLLIMILAQQQWSALRAEFRNRRRLGFYLLTALLISGNWLLYIWAVQQGRILEASLGYYINPLVNVLLGVLFLSERLNPRQLLAVLIAAIGVLVLVIGHGVFPWISLTLAFSFGSYGLLRKKAGHPPTLGLCVETVLIAPVALLFLVGAGRRRARGRQWRDGCAAAGRRPGHRLSLADVSPGDSAPAPVHRGPDSVSDPDPAIPVGGRCVSGAVYRHSSGRVRLHLAGAGAVQPGCLVWPSRPPQIPLFQRRKLNFAGLHLPIDQA